jgi:RNA polymerase sigma factor for flagellar operon FliA
MKLSLINESILNTKSKEDILKIGEEKIIKILIPSIKSIAKKYENAAASFDELVSEGMSSISQAIENFKDGQMAFSNYIYYYISSAIKRFSNKSSVVSDMPQTEDGKNVGYNVSKIQHLHGVNPEIVDDSSEKTNTTMLVNKALNRAFKLGDISEKELMIIQLLFGIRNGKSAEPKTPKEIADAVGVSMVRISQIKTKALEAIKNLYGSFENMKNIHEALYKVIMKII